MLVLIVPSKNRQKGFAVIFLLIFLLAIAVGALFFYKNFNKNESQKESFPISPTTTSNEDTPPLLLKSIGINLDYYDLKTGRAGDFLFTKQKLQFNRLFMGYGFVIPGTQASFGQDKSNPQPTFIVPLGTPVLSLVDGVVANIPTLWSGDYSIQITTDGTLQKWVYEIEHVVNLKVKVGDKVKAGQEIAEVGSFDRGTPQGYGAVEIGILKGGNPPSHVCPFVYLDESIKADTLKKITAFFKSWEEYIGDQTLYNENSSTPGCLILDVIPG